MTLTDPATFPDRNCAPPADPELWFPPEGNIRELRAATAHCHGCPALVECLVWALHHEAGKPRSARSGIWGGRTPAQRARMDDGERPPREISHGTEGGYRTHRRRGERACEACRRAAALAYALRRPGRDAS